ncbi:MAG TPA: hypothetical protein VFC19_40140 [Candidatus Limnocylindrales bacterium]|nr:hypothetical protein [Candidatus Limnocylindrales bacterium]
MEHKTILVIGATAHFGRQTVETLAAAGYRVRSKPRTKQITGHPARTYRRWAADHLKDLK